MNLHSIFAAMPEGAFGGEYKRGCPFDSPFRKRIATAAGTCREVAERFQVSPSAVSKMRMSHLRRGDFRPTKQGGRREETVILTGGLLNAIKQLFELNPTMQGKEAARVFPVSPATFAKHGNA